jgi:hypothetical protein
MINTPPKREFLERKKTESEDPRDTEREREGDQQNKMQRSDNRRCIKAKTVGSRRATNASLFMRFVRDARL